MSYINPDLRQAVFLALETMIPESVDKKNGRSGMGLWRILGHRPYDEYQYRLQTLQDNISLFTPKVLDEISQIAVSAGHELVKKKMNGYRAVAIPLS